MDNLLILFVCAFSANGFNFDTNNVQEIVQNTNSYFGYTVLLQKGSQPAVIVGAPQPVPAGGTLHRCSLDGKCSEYVKPLDLQKFPKNQNGNFFGVSLDGSEQTDGPLVGCAPRVVSDTGGNYYLPGWCVLKQNSSADNVVSAVLNPLIRETTISNNWMTPSSSYYDNAFGEAGIDIHYLQKENKVLLGAPGVKSWNGALIVQSLSNLNNYEILPRKTIPVASENNGYLGYKVTSARFERTRTKVWYVSGAPRDNDLFGNVRIYGSDGIPVAVLAGYEMGSYFGAYLLAVDLNNDNIDDILVGAPMAAGSSWDEGYVYVYKSYPSSSSLKFENVIRLTGSEKTGAKFGTSITSLGDIDLDSYADVAISAPYEDDGVGAVYIYRGDKMGINRVYSQRLSPLNFSPSFGNVRSFGQGLSRGVDIDGNGHNDLAVGAYKSKQVFVIKTISIIDYQLSLETNVSSISSISSNVMKIEYCIEYSQRSKTNDVKTVNFNLKVLLDYRAQRIPDIPKNVTVSVTQKYCKSHVIEIKESPLDISAFQISFKAEIQQSNVIGIGENSIEKVFPIPMAVEMTIPDIVLGLNKEMVVNVSAANSGEPGYGCKLNLNFPNVIELRDLKDCILENNTYMCPFADRLISNKEIQLKFDITLKNPDMNKITINFKVNCLGENDLETNHYDLNVNVLQQNSPYIQGSSVPDNFYFKYENIKDKEISHIFKIGNGGPSPLKLEVFILLPMMDKDGVDIFVAQANGLLNGIQIQCYPVKNTAMHSNDADNRLTESLNKTVLINCFQRDMECLQLFCDGGYLHKSTELADFHVKITVKTDLLASHYRRELLQEDILIYTSTAFLRDSGERIIEGHAATQIFTSSEKPIPIWIYIVGSLIGLLLLGLLIFLLYKCHFFERNYRDKLNDEKLMESDIEQDTHTLEENTNQSSEITEDS